MNILALDMATKTGWAYGVKGLTHLSSYDKGSGVENFRKRTGESQGMIFLRFRTWLNNFLVENPIDLIVYEQSHQRGRAATEMGNGLLAVLKMEAETQGMDFSSVHSATIKKFATGRGNAGKDMVIAAFRGRLGREPIDDNEADAYWLLQYAIKEYC